MIYAALFLVLAFTAFFARLTIVSVKRGYVSNRGSIYARAERPMAFWIGIAGWVLNTTAGVFFFVVLLAAIVR